MPSNGRRPITASPSSALAYRFTGNAGARGQSILELYFHQVFSDGLVLLDPSSGGGLAALGALRGLHRWADAGHRARWAFTDITAEHALASA